MQTEISEAKATKVFIENVLADFGQIDILVNNAGIIRDRTFKEMSFDEWRQVIDTNLSSAFNTCKVTPRALPVVNNRLRAGLLLVYVGLQ